MKKLFTKLAALMAGMMVTLSAWGEAFDPSVNIAEGKTAVSGWTSAMGDNEKPAKSLDGNTSTQWVAWGANSADKRSWFGIDLGGVYSLTEFATIWRSDGGGGDVPSHYLIQVAITTGNTPPADFVDDAIYGDEGWTTVAEVNETQVRDALENRYSFNTYPVRARYIRLVSVQNLNVALSEFRLFSDGNSADEVTPTITSSTSTADILSGSATLALTATDHNGDPLKSFVFQDQFGAYYYGVTDGSDQLTIRGLENKRYIFTAWAVESGYKSAARIIVVGENTFDSSTNLALNKPAYAVGYKNTGEMPEKANDGNLGIGWRSAEPVLEADRNNVWWYVDLQDEYELKSMALFWEGAYATSFIAQVRKEAPTLEQAGNDNEWLTFLDYSGIPNVGDQEANINLYGDVEGSAAAFTITPKGRYIRLRITGANKWEWGVKLFEVRLYANGYVPVNTTAPIITSASYKGVSADGTNVDFNVSATDDATSPIVDYLLVDQNGVPHLGTASDGVLTITGLPTGKNVNVTIYALDASFNKSEGKIVEITYLRPDENIALGKTAYGCIDYSDSEGVEQVNDGSTATYMTTYTHNPSTNEWWYVNLGDYYDIRRIEVVWMSGYSSTNYSIQYRQSAPAVDGTTTSEWDNISEFTSLAGNQSIDISDTKAQYICLRSSAREEAGQLRLTELRVFGKAFATPDNEKPIISEASYNGTTSDYTGLNINITVSDNVTAVDDLIYKVEDPSGVEHTAIYSAGVITVTGMPTFKDGDITIYAIDEADNKSMGYVMENVSYVDPSENLALNKNAYACVHINDGEGRAMPVDGNISTTWTSYSHGNHANDWWYVDLGDFYDIRRIEVVWQTERHSTDFSIQYRQNAPAVDGATEEEWETKYSGMSGDQELDDIANMQARYICMRSKDYYHEQEHAQVRLAEFRVYGKAFASADANPPVITTAYVSYNDDGKAYLNLEATDIEDGNIKTFKVTNVTSSTTETMSTDVNNQIVIDGLTLNVSYVFEIQAVDAADNHSSVVELNVNVPRPTSENIAQDGTATAGYEKDANENASKAIDGRNDTQWVTYGCNVSENLWWEVDLNAVYHLTKIAVLWNDEHYATKYTIKTRVSNTEDWITQPQVSVSDEGLKETSVDLKARYVRIVIDEQRYDFTRMHEVQIFANAKIIEFEDNAMDNSGLIAANDGRIADVILSRTIEADGTWYTLCLPFDMSAEKVMEVFGASKIAELTGSEDRGSLIHLNFDYVNAIEAGHAYLFKPSISFLAGTTIEGVTIKNVDPIESGDALMKFQGTYNQTVLTDANIRFVADDDYLYSPADGGTTMGAFRCYFTIPSGSPAMAPGKRARIVVGTQVLTDMESIQTSEIRVQKVLRNGQLLIIRDGRTYNAQGGLMK